MSKARNTRRKNTQSETTETQSTVESQGDNNMTDNNLDENNISSQKEAVAVGDSNQQPTVTIDGNEYALESLGQKGREQLQNLRVTDYELQRLQDRLAITRTARNTYARILADIVQDIEPAK
ncbi:DUF6447 family protein [Vreelandella aquamarina]|uniref:DUF6447 family protein n=1 Tax=Vreelandella aquamarina TaxID=77097 RepID=UPI0025B9BCF0|nr:DUF6447 family protein [Halomonas sp.]